MSTSVFSDESGSLSLMIRVVYLPIPSSLKDRLPIPGGIEHCQPLFYSTVPQSRYD